MFEIANDHSAIIVDFVFSESPMLFDEKDTQRKCLGKLQN